MKTLDNAGLEHLRKNTDLLETTSKYTDGSLTRKFEQFGLSLDEEVIIRHYTGPSHVNLNQALEGGAELTPELLEYKNLLNKALSKLPDYEGTVYRGLGASESVSAKSWNIGQKITEMKFVSSSKVAEEAENFMILKGGDVRLVIESKTAKVIENVSFHPNEVEALFGSGKQFEVINKYLFPLDDGKIITEIVLKEL